MFKQLFTRKETCLFFIMSLLFFICINGYDAFLSSFMMKRNFDPEMIGLIMGATGLATVFLRFPLSVVSGVLHNRKFFMQISLILPMVLWPIAFFYTNDATLYIAKTASGIASATWVLYNIMFIRYFSAKEAPSAVAVLALASPVGVFIGNTICSFITQNLNPMFGFWVPAVAALLALAISLLLKESESHLEKPKLDTCLRSAWEQLTDKTIWFVGILCATVLIVPFATRDTLTPIYIVKLGGSSITIGMLSNLHLLFYALAVALCSSLFYPRLGMVKTAVVGSILQAIAALGVSMSESYPVIFFFQALAGFSFGMAFAVMMSLSVLNTSPEEQTARMGLFQTIYSTGMFWGPVLMGLMLKYFTIHAGYQLIAGLACIAAVLTALAAKLIQHRSQRCEIGLSTELTK
ncbi:MFS transporter [Paramixta manurensis]|uniref:MFS transporter n=1 Tax=Paramixta manurensis TaxID=2740817 RepID=A0A6M8UI67_9GAMM|nr:MFS transporter [Erwiniaceae bacterium PD-1]